MPDGWPLYAVAVSPDDRLMAIGDQRGTVTIYDRATRRPLGRYTIRGGLVQPGLRFSPDGSTLAVPSLDPRNGREGLVDLIDPLTRQRRVRIVPPRFPGKANSATFLPLNRSSVATGLGPSFICMRVTEGIWSPTLMVMKFSVVDVKGNVRSRTRLPQHRDAGK